MVGMRIVNRMMRREGGGRRERGKLAVDCLTRTSLKENSEREEGSVFVALYLHTSLIHISHLHRLAQKNALRCQVSELLGCSIINIMAKPFLSLAYLDANCRLREANNFSRIPKLALKVFCDPRPPKSPLLFCALCIQVREHCLSMLTTALEDNHSKVKSHCIDPAQAAIDLEYEIFTSNKIQQSYKLAYNKKVKASVLQCLLVISTAHHCIAQGD